jgi:hypothetical protein
VPKRKQKEIYVRDAQGNILALYEVKNDSLYTKEFYMYGSQRLGYLEDDVFMGRKCISKWCNVLTPVLPMFPSTLSNSVSIVFGKKRYELSDWLGNVRVVINDRKTPVNIGTTTVGYKAQVVSVSDYYSFGSTIKERTYNFTYRFGYNAGSEIDRGVYSQSDRIFNTFHREGDTYLARWWSVDPEFKKMPWQTPYSLMDNDPIRHNDPKGDQIDVIVDLGFIGYDLYDIGRSLIKGEGTTKDQWIALGLDVAGALIPFATGLGAAYKASNTAAKLGSKLAIHTAEKQVIDVSGEELAKLGIKEVKHTGPGTFKKVAVIGTDMEKRVKPFAEMLRKKGMKVETFKGSEEAEKAFRELIEKNKGGRVTDAEVYKSQLFKENVAWREKLQKEGYDILDIGATKESTFYKMEKDPVWNKVKPDKK